MDELTKMCKCGLYLEINENRNMYETVEQKIKETNERDKENGGTEPEVDEELAQRMIKENMFVSLQFYPNTPIGFYKVYGTSTEEVIKIAKEVLNNL